MGILGLGFIGFRVLGVLGFIMALRIWGGGICPGLLSVKGRKQVKGVLGFTVGFWDAA